MRGKLRKAPSPQVRRPASAVLPSNATAGAPPWPRGVPRQLAPPARLERVPRLGLPPLHRELDETVAQLRIGDPARLEELCEDARLGEARDRVELVDEHFAVVADEEVAPGQPGARRDAVDARRE